MFNVCPIITDENKEENVKRSPPPFPLMNERYKSLFRSTNLTVRSRERATISGAYRGARVGRAGSRNKVHFACKYMTAYIKQGTSMYSKRSRPSRLVAAQTLMTSLSLIRIPTVVTVTRGTPRYTQRPSWIVSMFFLLATPKCCASLRVRYSTSG